MVIIKALNLAYWRSTSGFEVDFILNDKTAVEIKAKTNTTHQDYKGLRALKEEALLKNYILVSLEDTSRKVEDIQILPWKKFIENMWQGEYV
jgi:predicted AAA+ superfamily ATPase